MRERIGEIAKKTKENLKKVTAVAAIAGSGALFLAGCGVGDVLPHDKSQDYPTHTLKEARKTALNKYEHKLGRMNPSEKFAAQYLGVFAADVVKTKATDYDGENLSVKDFYKFKINNACLKGTVFDIAGGELKITANGFLSSLSARADFPAPAAFAYVGGSRPDVLHVKPIGQDGSSYGLSFRGVEGNDQLSPLDQFTSDVLDTNGCDTGLVSHVTVGEDPDDIMQFNDFQKYAYTVPR
ncbi:MAG TPA: hypothetical protein VFW77_02960 [Candidatus Saccharimonadales bacterium]|nr:hypothetical protein [Candidatus Saccharimonadales bacterium]